MSSELAETTPSEGLKRQCRVDEEIKWVVEKDMKTVVLGAVSDSASLFVVTAIFGVTAGVFTVAGTDRVLLGAAVFLLVAVGPPSYKILRAVLDVKRGGVEYAATTDRFVEYRETLTSTDVNSVPIERTRDAEYSRDMADKIFGTGDVRIEGARGDSLYFNNAPDGDALLRAVREEIADSETVDVANPQATAASGT